MTPESKIRLCLAEFGKTEQDYELRWSQTWSQWELRMMPNMSLIYGSCARSMIRAIRRRMNRRTIQCLTK